MLGEFIQVKDKTSTVKYKFPHSDDVMTHSEWYYTQMLGLSAIVKVKGERAVPCGAQVMLTTLSDTQHCRHIYCSLPVR